MTDLKKSVADMIIQQNIRAVMQTYGFDDATTTETSCVAELMRMYQKLTEGK